MLRFSTPTLFRGKGSHGQRGQIVVEYILLLMVAVTIAVIITSTMVSRSNENPGFLIVKWRQIIETIGSDTADDLRPVAE